MADANSYTKPQQFLVSGQNPSKFYSHFLYKALVVAVVLAILPLFPSQAPEFFNETVLTRSWELLHLIFVGIAVSYGLFSRRHDEIDKENHSNHRSSFDNAQSYVSRILQVSSVFDEEVEIPSGSDENKIQTWNNQYYRNEPVVMVANDHSVLENQFSPISKISEKPLLLPVRSLKQRLSDPDVVESSTQSSGISGSLSRSNSNSGSKRFSNNLDVSRNGEFGGLDHKELEEKLKENVVLPSPIPWRSRSGRMEVKEEVYGSMEESEFNRLESRSFRSQRGGSSRPNSTSSSPKLSPSASLSSFSSESQGKNAEDLVRKKGVHKSSPPAPPPLPLKIHKSPLMKSNSCLVNDPSSPRKELMRSFTSEPNDMGRSKRSNSGVEAKQKSQIDVLSMGKSVRKIRAGETTSVPRKGRDGREEGMKGEVEIRLKDVESNLLENPARKSMTFDQSPFKTRKAVRESVTLPPKSTFLDFSEEEKNGFVDDAVMESGEESERDEDSFEGTRDMGEIEGHSNEKEAASNNANDAGPDVDKKADEFIAKFREQIRLQRIESIKKSSAQISKNSSR